ncbi:MAG: DoxX family protein [Williamsia sp.]|nr:DoxX family protein [Williamsia sp.]
MNNKTKNILRWAPSGLVAFALIGSASSKLSGVQPLIEHFTQIGLVSFVKGFAILELLFLGLFLFPRTIKMGLLLLTAYFGGAIAVELPYGLFMAGPLAILSLVWIAAYLRNPSVFSYKQEKVTLYRAAA